MNLHLLQKHDITIGNKLLPAYLVCSEPQLSLPSLSSNPFFSSEEDDFLSKSNEMKFARIIWWDGRNRKKRKQQHKLSNFLPTNEAFSFFFRKLISLSLSDWAQSVHEITVALNDDKLINYFPPPATISSNLNLDKIRNLRINFLPSK